MKFAVDISNEAHDKGFMGEFEADTVTDAEALARIKWELPVGSAESAEYPVVYIYPL